MAWNGLGVGLSNLWLLADAETRSISPENFDGAKGRGGMATVYRSRDLRHDRDVALKVLRPELAESLGRERFLRAMRLAARLNHPHILALHDSGHADGFPFDLQVMRQYPHGMVQRSQ